VKFKGSGGLRRAKHCSITDTHMFGGMPSIPAHHACVYLGGTAGVSMIIILFAMIAMITFMAALFAQETGGKSLVD
jgi:hypothetical protein